jgi:hypothetical protein
MAPQCTAVRLPDNARCTDEATHANGLFCWLHSQQVYGLYRGYKRRNADPDRLNASPPPYLADSQTALQNQKFEDVEDEAILNDIHQYLFRKYQLLDRVIRAQRMHHSQFYSLTMDYGHQKYYDKLLNERNAVRQALEHLERRIAEVLYKKAESFKWVREKQDKEDAVREKEVEKIKKEAKLFKRHWKAVRARLKQKRKEENMKMQQAFLEQAYRERRANTTEEEKEDEEAEWDPIEDAIEDERANFLDMMRRLLWIGGALTRRHG